MKVPSSMAVLNVGFGNVVPKSRVVAIVSPASAPMKRLKEAARAAGKLVDATQGRRTRGIVVTDSDHVVLSAIQAETLAARFASDALDLSPGGEVEGEADAGETWD
ncbi:MAG: DUF370 domain-containing protein [Deltaproteobacteria bacterium]|nr:DUF370 domain-containing protein [Deltaproteobacteria bacterium]